MAFKARERSTRHANIVLMVEVLVLIVLMFEQ